MLGVQEFLGEIDFKLFEVFNVLGIILGKWNVCGLRYCIREVDRATSDWMTCK